MVVLGIGVRVILAPFTSYPNDDLPWYSMVVSGMQHLPVYARPGFSYPPLWGWILETLGRLLQALGATPATLGIHDAALNRADMITGGALATTITSPLFNVCIKAMLAGADLLTALYLAELVPRLSDRARAREWAFGLYFLNPLVVNESAVRAGIDGLVALSIAATLVMVTRGRFALAGAALAGGAFVKLTPVLVAPLVVCALVSGTRRSGQRWREAWRAAGSIVGGGAAVAGVVFIALALTGQWGGFLENTFSRVQTGLLIGGPAFGGLRHFAAFSGLARFSLTHGGAILLASASCEAAAVVGTSVWVWRKARHQHTLTVLVLGLTMVLAVVVATTPTSQPGYVLWFLPGLVLLAAARPGAYLPFLVVLSAAAVVFSLTYYSPAQALFPLAEYTKLVSPRALASGVQRWFTRGSGLWGTSYKEDYAALCAACAMLAYLFLVPQCLEDRVLAGRAPVPCSDNAASRRSRGPVPVPVVVVATMVALAVVVVPNVGPAPPAGSTATRLLATTYRDGTLSVALSARPIAGERSLRTVIFPVSRPLEGRRVDVVVDASMPFDYTNLEDERGVYDNLRAELSLRGYAPPVTTIDSVELQHVLSDTTNAAGTSLVDTSGVLPSNVFAPTRDLLLPWLRAGGVLYWGGGPVGLLHATPGASAPQVWGSGPQTLLGAAAELPAEPGRQATSPTPVGQALGLQYQDASFSPSLHAARIQGAIFLGFVGSSASSVTSFPIGGGRLVVFGGMMYENAQVAGDIALLQASGVLYASGPMVASTTRLPPGGARWALSVRASTGRMERVAVFDPRRLGIAFSTFDVGGSPAQAGPEPSWLTSR